MTDLPVAGVDDGGEAVVAWPRDIGATTIIETNSRQPGGSFALAGVRELSSSVLNAAFPALAIAPDGTTLVLWSQTTTSDVRYNERTAAGAWLMDAKIASPGDVTATAPSVAMDAAGNVAAISGEEETSISTDAMVIAFVPAFSMRTTCSSERHPARTVPKSTRRCTGRRLKTPLSPRTGSRIVD